MGKGKESEFFYIPLNFFSFCFFLIVMIQTNVGKEDGGSFNIGSLIGYKSFR